MSKDCEIEIAKEQQVARDLAALSAVLQPRIEQARRGELSTKTFEEIREGAKRRMILREKC